MVSEFLIRSQISSMIAALRVSLALLNAALERECKTDLYQKLSRIGLNIQLVHETHIFTTMLATRNSNDCVIVHRLKQY
jgi:DNA-binding MurR/RpiR family transcriptional regulator